MSLWTSLCKYLFEFLLPDVYSGIFICVLLQARPAPRGLVFKKLPARWGECHSHLGKLQGAGRKEMPRRQGRRGWLHGGELPTMSGRATSVSRRREWEGSHGGQRNSTAQSRAGDQTPRRRERAYEEHRNVRGPQVSTLGCTSSPCRPWTRHSTPLDLDFFTCSAWVTTALTPDGIVRIQRGNTYKTILRTPAPGWTPRGWRGTSRSRSPVLLLGVEWPLTVFKQAVVMRPGGDSLQEHSAGQTRDRPPCFPWHHF